MKLFLATNFFKSFVLINRFKTTFEYLRFKMSDICEMINNNRADSIRKYVVFNHEFSGNHILMRQINKE